MKTLVSGWTVRCVQGGSPLLLFAVTVICSVWFYRLGGGGGGGVKFLTCEKDVLPVNFAEVV